MNDQYSPPNAEAQRHEGASGDRSCSLERIVRPGGELVEAPEKWEFLPGETADERAGRLTGVAKPARDRWSADDRQRFERMFAAKTTPGMEAAKIFRGEKSAFFVANGPVATAHGERDVT